MSLDPADPIDQQIQKLRELFDHLDEPDVRDQWIAHHEVERDPPTQNFRPPDLPTIGALYATLEEMVPVIVRSVAHLALVLRSTDIGPEEFERLMKQRADIFWETQP
jgi:hypothetical protein